MPNVLMPKLSDSMEEGLILQWLIEDGADVALGDELVDIETDKATMTYQAEVAGQLQILVPQGSTVAVGEVIATVGAVSETKPPASAEPGVDAHEPPEPAIEVALATPVARRLAALHGISLDTLEGSGPRGRITKADVLNAGGTTVARTTDNGGPAKPNANENQQLTRLQQTIARRMTESKATVPHFQVQSEARMDAALAMRAQLEEIKSVDSRSTTPSVNDLIVKAAALALQKHPYANGSYKDGLFELHEQVNVGVAVAADGALVVPTLFDADRKSLPVIAQEMRRLAERVRTGEITPPELSGATFTVSNLGMYGMTAISPVINPPQSAILGVGAIRATLARDANGEIVDRSVVTLTLSCDHRILYGADAARFLSDIKALLEAPIRLAVGY